MPFYFYLFTAAGLLMILALIRFFMLRKQHAGVNLFAEAIKNENSGNFEEAIIAYNNALTVVKKNKFHNDLENKITEKLKILNSTIAYNKSFRLTRSATAIEKKQ